MGDEDVLAELDGELSEPEPETLEDAMRLSYPPGDYERFVKALDSAARDVLRRIVKERPRRQTRAVPGRIRSSHHRLACRELGPLPEALK